MIAAGAGCLLVVTDVKSWGVQGFVQIPQGGRAYYRLPTGTFERTGAKVIWAIGNETDIGP